MLEAEFFKRSRPDFEKLETFGFTNDDGAFRYEARLPGGQFLARLEVAGDGAVSGRVIDTDTGEEYLPVRVEDPIGSFVGGVRKMYLDFLGSIEDACFVPVNFMSDQANAMEIRINGAYGVAAEFPWEKYAGNGTFKCRENDKWFAAVLTVAFGKLDGGDADAAAGNDVRHDDDEIVEVLNLKTRPEETEELVKRPGIYRAWHMNKKHWISVILDGTLSDDEAFALVRGSYALAAEGKAAQVKGTGAWMIPSNPGIYDVDAGFRDGKGEIEWHQHNRVKAGDEVFIYCSAPYSAILYRCEVVAADLTYRGMFRESRRYDRSMRIKLIEKYPPDKYTLSFIKAHGGSVVRSARTMPGELYDAIKRD